MPSKTEIPEKDGCIDFGYFLFNYGRFHNNFWNRVIHFLFIPVITTSGGVLWALYMPNIEFGFEVPIVGKFLLNPTRLNTIAVLL